MTHGFSGFWHAYPILLTRTFLCCFSDYLCFFISFTFQYCVLHFSFVFCNNTPFVLVHSSTAFGFITTVSSITILEYVSLVVDLSFSSVLLFISLPFYFLNSSYNTILLLTCLFSLLISLAKWCIETVFELSFSSWQMISPQVVLLT